MQNITRTLTEYDIKAYSVAEDENGVPSLAIIAECQAESASMTKTLARAELAAATGEPLPKGVTVKWKPIGTVTYAMPLDKFLDSAAILKKEIL